MDGSRTVEEKEVNRVHYRIARREAKRAVAVAKSNAYDKLYICLLYTSDAADE